MKIKTLSELQDIKNENCSSSFGLVGGYYDLLHIGHVAFLEKCKKYCNKLIVYVHNDDTARNIKGPSRPFVSAFERALLLSKLECVDYVIIIEDVLNIETALDFDYDIIKKINIDFYICVVENDASRYRIENLRNRVVGTEIIAVERQVDEISTTILERKIKSNVRTNRSDTDQNLLKIERTSEFKFWIDRLYKYSNKSNCRLAHVAAIIVYNNEELSFGVNQSQTRCWCHLTNNFINKYRHPKCYSLHAEQNAILDIVERSNMHLLKDSILFVEKSPCFDCAKLILKYNIGTVIYVKEYTESDGRDLLIDKGVLVKRFIGQID